MNQQKDYVLHRTTGRQAGNEIIDDDDGRRENDCTAHLGGAYELGSLSLVLQPLGLKRVNDLKLNYFYDNTCTPGIIIWSTNYIKVSLIQNGPST